MVQQAKEPRMRVVVVLAFFDLFFRIFCIHLSFYPGDEH